MKKDECQWHIEALSKFLKKNKNKYAQDMSKALKYKWDTFSFGCGNDRVEIKVSISLIKGEVSYERGK